VDNSKQNGLQAAPRGHAIGSVKKAANADVIEKFDVKKRNMLKSG
jgi:hypothetical protein